MLAQFGGLEEQNLQHLADLFLLLFGVIEIQFLPSLLQDNLAQHSVELDGLYNFVLVVILHDEEVEADEEVSQSHSHFLPVDVHSFRPLSHGHALNKCHIILHNDVGEEVNEADLG